jgi:hypothetical protein
VKDKSEVHIVISQVHSCRVFFDCFDPELDIKCTIVTSSIIVE